MQLETICADFGRLDLSRLLRRKKFLYGIIWQNKRQLRKITSSFSLFTPERVSQKVWHRNLIGTKAMHRKNSRKLIQIYSETRKWFFLWAFNNLFLSFRSLLISILNSNRSWSEMNKLWVWIFIDESVKYKLLQLSMTLSHSSFSSKRDRRAFTICCYEEKKEMRSQHAKLNRHQRWNIRGQHKCN